MGNDQTTECLGQILERDTSQTSKFDCLFSVDDSLVSKPERL